MKKIVFFLLFLAMFSCKDYNIETTAIVSRVEYLFTGTSRTGTPQSREKVTFSYTVNNNNYNIDIYPSKTYFTGQRVNIRVAEKHPEHFILDD